MKVLRLWSYTYFLFSLSIARLHLLELYSEKRFISWNAFRKKSEFASFWLVSFWTSSVVSSLQSQIIQKFFTGDLKFSFKSFHFSSSVSKWTVSERTPSFQRVNQHLGLERWKSWINAAQENTNLCIPTSRWSAVLSALYTPFVLFGVIEFYEKKNY